MLLTRYYVVWYSGREVVAAFSSFRFPELSQPI
jgi:hypothetical protein